MNKKAVVALVVLIVTAAWSFLLAEVLELPGYTMTGTITLAAKPESQCVLVAGDGTLYCVISAGGSITAYRADSGSSVFSKYDMGLTIDALGKRHSVRDRGFRSGNQEAFFIEENTKSGKTIRRIFVDDENNLVFDHYLSIPITGEQKITQFEVKNGPFDSRYIWVKTETDVLAFFVEGDGGNASCIPVALPGQTDGTLIDSLIQRQSDSSYIAVISRKGEKINTSFVFHVANGVAKLELSVSDELRCAKVVITKDVYGKRRAIFVYPEYFKSYSFIDDSWKHKYTVSMPFDSIMPNLQAGDKEWLLSDAKLSLLGADSGDCRDTIVIPRNSAFFIDSDYNGAVQGICYIASIETTGEACRIVKQGYVASGDSIALVSSEELAEFPKSGSFIMTNAYAILLGTYDGVSALCAAGSFGRSEKIENIYVDEVLSPNVAILIKNEESTVLYMNETAYQALLLENIAGVLSGGPVLELPYNGAKNIFCLFLIENQNGNYYISPYVAYKGIEK